jgi:hypothetical protein
MADAATILMKLRRRISIPLRRLLPENPEFARMKATWQRTERRLKNLTWGYMGRLIPLPVAKRQLPHL